MGGVAATVFTVLGASYGTAKSSGGIFAGGILRPDRLMQNTLCPIMAQMLAIYGFVVSVIISNGLFEKMALHTAFLQLAAGLSVGLCGLAAGFTLGIAGDAGSTFAILSISSSILPLLILSPVRLSCPREGVAPPRCMASLTRALFETVG